MSYRPISEIINAISDDESNELSVFDQLNEEIMTGTLDTAAIAPASPSADDIDLIMNQLDIDEPTGAALEEIVEDEVVEDEVVEEASGLELDEIEVGAADPDELRDLEVSLAKTEAYETAESEIEVVAATPGAEPEEAAAKPAKKAKAKSSKPAAPKVERDLKALPDSAFQLTLTSDAAADKTALLMRRPSQKKIAEKFDQTIAALHAGRLPSTYVVDCFKILKAKSSVTATDLVAALKADGYSDGTARSQVGQIMVLFDVLGIAERSKGMLVLNEDSTFASKLGALLV